MTNSKRTNQQWLTELRGSPEIQAQALETLRGYLLSSVNNYLSQDRSDLIHRSEDELQCMAEDMTQITILRVIDNLHSFRGEGSFIRWAIQIAKHETIRELRRIRYKDFSLDTMMIDGEFLPKMLRPSAALYPELITERTDALERLEQIMQEVLSHRQYTVLVAVLFDDIPREIVAEQLNTNCNALYKVLFDGRRKVRRRLEREGLSANYLIELFAFV